MLTNPPLLHGSGGVDLSGDNTTYPAPPQVDPTTVVWPLPAAGTAMATSDWPILAKDFLPNLDVSWNTQLPSIDNILVYGPSLAVLPVFDMAVGLYPQHGIAMAAGRAGLARCVVLSNAAMLLAYASGNLLDRKEAFISRNAIYWAGGAYGLTGYRIGTPPGGSFDRVDLWTSMSTMGVSSFVKLTVGSSSRHGRNKHAHTLLVHQDIQGTLNHNMAWGIGHLLLAFRSWCTCFVSFNLCSPVIESFCSKEGCRAFVVLVVSSCRKHLRGKCTAQVQDL